MATSKLRKPKPKDLTETMRSKGYVSPTEAAQLCHVSRPTVYSWIASGDLETVRVGHGRGRVFVALVSLRAMAGMAMEGGR